MRAFLAMNINKLIEKYGKVGIIGDTIIPIYNYDYIEENNSYYSIKTLNITTSIGLYNFFINYADGTKKPPILSIIFDNKELSFMIGVQHINNYNDTLNVNCDVFMHPNYSEDTIFLKAYKRYKNIKDILND